MSDLLNQVKATASSALEGATNLATQAATQASNLATQAANSQAAATVTEQAKNLGSQAYTGAGTLAGQAHAQAHAIAPSIVPAPSTTVAGVDTSDDIEPKNKVETAKFEKLFDSRPTPAELQDKGILKGAPDDALAAKKLALQKSMLEDKLDAEIAQRPAAETLVKKGILNPDEAPPA